MTVRKFVLLLQLCLGFLSLVSARPAEEDQSMIYAVEGNIKYYCTLGTKKDVEANNGAAQDDCIKRHRHMVHYLPDGTKVYPFLKDGSPGGFVLNCTADIIHGSLSSLCNRLIHSTCNFTCDQGYIPILDSLTCNIAEPFTNVSAAWSQSHPCKRQICASSIAHGKLIEPCNTEIHGTCNIKCDHGYTPVVDSMTCNAPEPFSRASATWSHPVPCKPQGLPEKTDTGQITFWMLSALILGFILFAAIVVCYCYKTGCRWGNQQRSCNSSNTSLNKNNNDAEAQSRLLKQPEQQPQPPIPVADQPPQLSTQGDHQPPRSSIQVANQPPQPSNQGADQPPQAADQPPQPSTQGTDQPPQLSTQPPRPSIQVAYQPTQPSNQGADQPPQAADQPPPPSTQSAGNQCQPSNPLSNLLNQSLSFESLPSNPSEIAPGSPGCNSRKGLSDVHFTDYPSGCSRNLPVIQDSYWSVHYNSGKVRTEPLPSNESQICVPSMKKKGENASYSHEEKNSGCKRNIRCLLKSSYTQVNQLFRKLEPSTSIEYRTTLEGYVLQTEQQLKGLGFDDLMDYKKIRDKHNQPDKYFSEYLLNKMAEFGHTVPNVLDYFKHWNEDTVKFILLLHDCPQCRKRYGHKDQSL